MKAIKGFILFCFLAGTISACFDAPEFDITPEISFKKIQFKKTPAPGDPDSLILTLNFKDGDGDLGLDDNYSDAPFNDAFYYLAAGPTLSDTARVTTRIVYTDTFDAYILLQSSDSELEGPLVIDRTRSKPGFGDLPPYDPNSCLNYSFTELLVPERFNAVDATYNIIDTLNDQSGNLYFVVQEAMLYKKNPYYYNIDVEFLVLENGSYVKYDWYKNFCIDFNGRFPVLGNEKRPLEGTIRYAMANASFEAVLSVKTLKLRIRIRDRALRTSKEIETPPFTLSSI